MRIFKAVAAGAIGMLTGAAFVVSVIMVYPEASARFLGVKEAPLPSKSYTSGHGLDPRLRRIIPDPRRKV